jgi:hypothetical protein
MFRRSKKAQGIRKIMTIILVLAVLVIGLVFAYRAYLAGKEIGFDCNTDVMRCGCFFNTQQCPSDITFKKDVNSKICPPNNVVCTDSTYKDELKKAPRDAEEKKWFGTCCYLTQKPSKNRLWKEEDVAAAPTTGEPAEPQPTGPLMSAEVDQYGFETMEARGLETDCSKVTTCDDYSTVEMMLRDASSTDMGDRYLLCYHDPCNIQGCLPQYNNNCVFTGCGACLTSCSKDTFYECGGPELKEKNPCDCV